MLATRSERRRTLRYQGYKKVILLQQSGIHHLRDISFGGLSFRCPKDVIFPAKWPLEIMVAGSLLRVIRMPVRLVHERIDGRAGQIFPLGKEVGVEYLALDEKNRPLLARLISYLQQTASEYRPGR